MDEIPDVFTSQLPEIIQILESNIRSLCIENQGLVVIGMQVCLVLQYLLLMLDKTINGINFRVIPQ